VPCVTEVDTFARNGCVGVADYVQTTPDGGCQSTGGVNIRSFKSAVTNGCAMTSAVTTTGTLAIAGEQTVCCM
jgi:hypothetical protein